MKTSERIKHQTEKSATAQKMAIVDLISENRKTETSEQSKQS